MDELGFDPEECSLLFEVTVPSVRDAVPNAADEIMDYIRAMPCAQLHLDEVRLALVEALANAVVHGNKENPDKKVTVHGACERGERLLLAVTDEGDGFDPSTLPNPTLAENLYANHGRGVYLICQLLPESEYRLGGRQVILRKRVCR